MWSRRVLVASAVCTVVAAGAAVLAATELTGNGPANLLANPSVEHATGAVGGTPRAWYFTSWGHHSATRNWVRNGRDGRRSLSTTVTGYTTGAAGWGSAPVQVRSGARYMVGDWSISDVPTRIEVVFDGPRGGTIVTSLSEVPPTGRWTRRSLLVTVPDGASRMAVQHVLKSAGTLNTDAYSITQADTGQPGSDFARPPMVNVAVARTVRAGRPETVIADADPDVVAMTLTVDGVTQGPERPGPGATWEWTPDGASLGEHRVTVVARTGDGRVASAVASVMVDEPVATGPYNLFNSGSGETNAASGVPGWTTSRWGQNSASFVRTEPGHDGGYGLRTEITGYADGGAGWQPVPVTVKAGHTYLYAGWYRSSANSDLVAVFTMPDGSVGYRYLDSVPATPGWKPVQLKVDIPAGAAKLTVAQVLVGTGSLDIDDVKLTEHTPAVFDRAMVSLTFDDGWLSHYTNVLPALNRYGVRGTFYVLSGMSADRRYMSREQMAGLADAGNEIASHTIDHPHLPALDPTQIDRQLRESQSVLKRWYGPGAATNFCAPYGESSATVLSTARSLYRSHRSTVEGFNRRDDIDPYNIKVQNVVSTTPPTDVARWVAQAVADRSWLVLVYHEVDLRPNDATYAVPPTEFNQHLAAIVAAGPAVLTINEALDVITPQMP
jgi:peptidoglycan/xylan/chitin deacetylase (PgdA/CDA1 family)